VACDIPLESSRGGLQLCFGAHFNRRCTQSYGPPKSWESQLWEFRDSHLGIPRQNDIWVLVMWPGTKYAIRGKVVASPSPGRGGFPQVRAMVNLMSSSLPVACPNTKRALAMH
jgi:hypothetical protein